MWRVYKFTSHNRVYILSCKHASRPIRSRVLSQLFYKTQHNTPHSVYHLLSIPLVNFKAIAKKETEHCLENPCFKNEPAHKTEYLPLRYNVFTQQIELIHFNNTLRASVSKYLVILCSLHEGIFFFAGRSC